MIAHLVARHYQRGAGDLATAVRLALGELRGASAVVAMCADEPDRLVAARLGNAGGVVLGVGDGEMFVASDMPAILEHTQRMIFLDSREVATVRREGARVTDLAGHEVEKVTTVQWNPVTVAKDGYKHFMLKRS